MMNDCVFLGLHKPSSRGPVLEPDFWLSPLTSRLSPWQETVTEAGCLLTLQMRSSKEPQCLKPCGYSNTTKCLFIKTVCIQIFLSCKTLIILEKKKKFGKHDREMLCLKAIRINRGITTLPCFTYHPVVTSSFLCSAPQYGYEGRVPMRSARLFYDISERARRIIESYFLLNSTLHFSYTHLVCRTAITGTH